MGKALATQLNCVISNDFKKMFYAMEEDSL